MASSAVYPKIRSAARFQLVTTPAVSSAITPTGLASSVACSRLSARCCATTAADTPNAARPMANIGNWTATMSCELESDAVPDKCGPSPAKPMAAVMSSASRNTAVRNRSNRTAIQNTGSRHSSMMPVSAGLSRAASTRTKKPNASANDATLPRTNSCSRRRGRRNRCVNAPGVTRDSITTGNTIVKPDRSPTAHTTHTASPSNPVSWSRPVPMLAATTAPAAAAIPIRTTSSSRSKPTRKRIRRSST